MFRFLMFFIGLAFILLGLVLSIIYVLAVAGLVMGQPFPGIVATPFQIIARFLGSVLMLTFGCFCFFGSAKN